MPDPTPIRGGVAAPWPDPPDPIVYQGLAGQIVRELEPHTEADPVGVLATLLACVGNAVGTGPHYRVGGTRHELRLFPILVGSTSSGRKGTAYDAVAPVFEAGTPDWWRRQTPGLVSGEGLIHAVRDPIVERKREQHGGLIIHNEVTTDAGAADKGLLVVETEFGSILKVMTRKENTLSAVIRNAWDGKILVTLAKTAPARATGAHISILGHITPEELVEYLTAADAHNGFANRFLWICVRRSKLLPFGGDLDDDAILAMGRVIEDAIAKAARLGRLTLSDDAREAWARVYGALTTGEEGIVGTILGRGAPYVLRIAGVYAALDASPQIERPHLDAGLALWGYADASVRQIFGATARPAANAAYRRTILDALQGGRLSQTEIGNDIFGGNLRAPEPHATLDALLAEGLVERVFERPQSGRGRNITYWELTEQGRQRGRDEFFLSSVHQTPPPAEGISSVAGPDKSPLFPPVKAGKGSPYSRIRPVSVVNTRRTEQGGRGYGKTE
jgi:hypothetical protein